VFYVKKKFKYEGPDGYRSFMHKLGSDAPDVQYSKDYNRFRGVMVCACISSEGLLHIDRIRGTVTADTYTAMLFSNALPEIHRRHGTEFTFQQDNAAPHRAATTLTALEEEGIGVLSWPALSPDLNPVENLWAILVRRVYAEGRCYQSDDGLWEGIQSAARTITVDEVRPLIASMPTRLTKLLTNQGKYVQ
jgi:hypothetical protein